MRNASSDWPTIGESTKRGQLIERYQSQPRSLAPFGFAFVNVVVAGVTGVVVVEEGEEVIVVMGDEALVVDSDDAFVVDDSSFVARVPAGKATFFSACAVASFATEDAGAVTALLTPEGRTTNEALGAGVTCF